MATEYPEARDLANTYGKQNASLEGARQLLAGEGLLITADDRPALTAMASGIWLRPSATRKVGNFLDMTPPAFATWTLELDPTHVLANSKTDPYEAFVDGTGEVAPVPGPMKSARLMSPMRGADHAETRYDHLGVLCFDDVYSLQGGKKLKNRSFVDLYFRRGTNDNVHVVAIATREPGLKVAHVWLGAVAQLTGHQLQPFRLAANTPLRHDNLVELISRLGTSCAGVCHTEVYRAEGTTPPGLDYRSSVLSGSEKTLLNPIGTVRTEMDQHGLSISSIRTVLSSPRIPRGRSEGVVDVKLSQPEAGGMLIAQYVRGRVIEDQASGVTDEKLAGARGLTWTDEEKRDFLLEIWPKVAGLSARAASALRRSA